MRLRIVFRYIGLVLLLISGFLLISAAISFFNKDEGFFPLLYSALISATFGIFPLIFVPSTEEISNNEGLLIVVSSWIIASVIGMTPYILWGSEFTFTNAWFESVSGFTTTGASILNDIESVPKGLLFWRAATHWIGGIGIIIFALSVLPSMGIAGMVLYRTEMSPASIRQFKVRTKEAARILLFVYAGITLLETISLVLCGLNLFDAITHSFATVATGGFSTRNHSVAAFANLNVEIVIMIFMILSGMNFALLFSLIIGQFYKLKISSVTKYYLLANLIGIIIVTINTYGHNYDNLLEALRYSSFQLLSIGTSTGFSNADSSIWPGFSQMIILFFTLQCACAGSTSGGIKIDRMVILFKLLNRKLKQLIYPNAVFNISVDKVSINETVIESATTYILFYIIIVLISSLLVSTLGVDMLSSFSGAAAMMGNVGPGLSSVGSVSNYAHLPYLAKWIFSFTMLLGRLEIYGLIIYFIPKTWR